MAHFLTFYRGFESKSRFLRVFSLFNGFFTLFATLFLSTPCIFSTRANITPTLLRIMQNEKGRNNLCSTLNPLKTNQLRTTIVFYPSSERYLFLPPSFTKGFKLLSTYTSLLEGMLYLLSILPLTRGFKSTIFISSI